MHTAIYFNKKNMKNVAYFMCYCSACFALLIMARSGKSEYIRAQASPTKINVNS